MMSNELAGIFMCFIFGLIFTFASWRAWTRQEVTSRHGRYHRKDSPFAFWFYTSLYIAIAVLLFISGIVFSISLLRSSWRTVRSTPRTQSLHAHFASVPHPEPTQRLHAESLLHRPNKPLGTSAPKGRRSQRHAIMRATFGGGIPRAIENESAQGQPQRSFLG